MEDDRFVISRMWSVVYWTMISNELRSGIKNNRVGLWAVVLGGKRNKQEIKGELYILRQSKK